jgi:cystathionine gamma-lyase
VLYPGLPDHPGHAIAKKQMRYFGPVLSFILRDKSAAETFLAKSKLLTDATSFGGITTTAERRARWGGDAIAEGFIRMSAGCEAVEDLLEDIAQALDAAR